MTNTFMVFSLWATGQDLLPDTGIRLEIKCSVNVMHFNYLEPLSPHRRSMEKLSSMELVPGPKKVGLEGGDRQ